MSEVKVGAVIADRGYDAHSFVERETSGAVAVIPSRRASLHLRIVDGSLYVARNKAERLVTGAPGIFQRVATCCGKMATFLTFVYIAASDLGDLIVSLILDGMSMAKPSSF